MSEESGMAKRESVEREAIHTWFSLSYANYLVVPRSVLQSMPDDWQRRFVLLLNEMGDKFPDLPWPKGGYDVRALAREPERVYVECGECDGDELLHAVRGFGPSKVRRILRATYLAGHRRLEHIPERQRRDSPAGWLRVDGRDVACPS